MTSSAPRSGRVLAVASVLGGLLGLLLFALTPNRYSASAQVTITSEKTASAAARLAGFAAQLGIGAALAGSGDAPDLFAAVARSRDVALRTMADTLCVTAQNCRPVMAALELPTDSTPLAEERRLRLLARRLEISMDARLGILRLEIWARSPGEAEGALRAHLRAFSEQVIARRESQARNERLFAEQRLVELRGKQRQVSDSLTAFYDQNRTYTQSPRLRFRERQLTEQLAIWQELVSNMARQVELARLDEARDTPVISFVERPYAAARRTFPKTTVFVGGGLVLGLLAGVARLLWPKLREGGGLGRLINLAD